MPFYCSSAEEVASACQMLAGFAVVHHDPPDPTALVHLFANMRPPASEVERRAVGFTLIMSAARFAEAIHRNFHDRFRTCGTCAFAAPPLYPSDDRNGDLFQHANIALWAERLNREFVAHHDSCAHRARRLLEKPGGTMLSVNELASRVAIGRRTLERQFVEEVHLTVAAYRTRLRVLAAVRTLRTGHDKRATAAQTAGWGSKKGMYDACGSVLGLAPADILRLSDIDASCLEARLLDPRAPLSVSAR